MSKTNPSRSSKQLVMEAYQRIKANAGGLQELINRPLKISTVIGNNLYKLCNRMVSEIYFPPAGLCLFFYVNSKRGIKFYSQA